MSTVEEFNSKGYTIVREAVSKELIDFVTQYALFDEMQDFQPEKNASKYAQVPAAHSKYGNAAMEAMLLKVLPLVEKNTGLELFPTYSYYRVYRNGDELKHHVDRPACEISVTLAFCYSYDDSKYQWPIWVDGTPIYLKPGDMAIYRGLDLDHWRDPLEYPENVWQVQAFLHYVDKNGVNADWDKDKRPSIGYLGPKSNFTQISTTQTSSTQELSTQTPLPSYITIT
jgi:hypothetical protein